MPKPGEPADRAPAGMRVGVWRATFVASVTGQWRVGQSPYVLRGLRAD